MDTTVLWFRRDLRVRDHPALAAAAAEGGRVVPLFVLDDVLLNVAGANRLAFLDTALAGLSGSTNGALRIVRGRPEQVVVQVAGQVGASAVHISSDHGPYGRRRDAAVMRALGDVSLVATGSPYGVTPGRLLKRDGSPYRVFGAYHRAWLEHGLRAPAVVPVVNWSDGDLPSQPIAATAGVMEDAAHEAWQQFRAERLARYAKDGNKADGSSRLSVYLRWGLLHPRTLHAALDNGEGARAFARELVWRDFYADVLWHVPESARHDMHPKPIEWAEPGSNFDKWRNGLTGYPYVDAGMRQLKADGWLPNRLRMVVASFLTKDLHVHWRHGARHFMHHLVDGDLASNQHGWQWVAGTGTDAAPYHRILNPVKQGQTHDPDGTYIRQWVPELAGVPGAGVHEPWTLREPPAAYPARIVDHLVERREALKLAASDGHG